MAALRRLGELLWIAEQHEVASPRRSRPATSASDIWPASSTNSTSTESRHVLACPQPGRAGDQRRSAARECRRDVGVVVGLAPRSSPQWSSSSALLHRAHVLAGLGAARAPQQEVADHRVALRGDADPLARARRARRPCARPCRSSPSRAVPGWRGTCRRAQARAGTRRRPVVRRPASGSPVARPPTRGATPQQKVARRAVRARPSMPWSRDPLADAANSASCCRCVLIGLGGISAGGCGTSCGRPRLRSTSRASSSMSTIVPALSLVGGIGGVDADLELVVLRRELVAVHDRTASPSRPRRRTRGRRCTRRSSTKSSSVRSCDTGRRTPPVGLLLAAVPVQQLRSSQRACCSLRCARRVVRHVAGERGCERLDLGVPLRQLAAVTVAAVSGAGSGDRTPLRPPPCGAFEPLAQAEGRLAVVAVVGLRSRRAACCSWSIEPLLVGDDARPGVHDHALGAVHVELLDLLERVRLGRRAHAPGAPPGRGRRTRRRAAGRRPRLRGCRACP